MATNRGARLCSVDQLDLGTQGFSLVDHMFDAYTQRCLGRPASETRLLASRMALEKNGVEGCKSVGEPHAKRHALKDGWKCRCSPLKVLPLRNDNNSNDGQVRETGGLRMRRMPAKPSRRPLMRSCVRTTDAHARAHDL